MHRELRRLASLAENALASDRAHALWQLRRLRDQPLDTQTQPILQQLQETLHRSAGERLARLQRLPRPSFDPALPITAHREEIARALHQHQVLVLCGETGSGKSTQLPKICLELGRGADGMIGHTQPRRIAARAVAQRIAHELGQDVGQDVGFKVRFSDRTSERTLIKVMTDGVLLNETQRDRLLLRYDTIIVDEAHERGLNIDFLLGYLRSILHRRPDLRLIITSATIDPQRFADHFARHGRPAPIINVSGRSYPVEIRYRPALDRPPDQQASRTQAPAGGQQRQGETALGDAIADAAHELARELDGDVLVFLPGEREIREAADALRKRGPKGYDLLPLYARLSTQQQDVVFQQHTKPRIVLATNVAETSLTVPGVRGVIDTGLARMSRYSARTRVQRLPIEPISQASAAQRSGRCGRVGPGIAIRLYEEQDLAKRDPFTQPEILRTNLASVVLQMRALRLGRVQDFPFIDPPDPRMVKDAEDTLRELGALGTVDAEDAGEGSSQAPTGASTGATTGAESVPAAATAAGVEAELHVPAEHDRRPRRRPAHGPRSDGQEHALTALGQELARLPVDPRIGRMLLESVAELVLPEMLVIAAYLSVQDPRDRPWEQRDQADASHARFADEGSDFVACLNLWKHFRERTESLGSSRLRKALADEFLSHTRLREWADVHRQLRDMMEDLGYRADGSGNRRRRAGRSERSPEPVLTRDSKRPPPTDPTMYAAIHRAVLSGMLINVGKLADGREYQGTHGSRFEVHPSSPMSTSRPQWIVAAELVRTTKLFARTVARVQPKWIERVAEHLIQRTHADPAWDAERQRVYANERITLFGLELVADRKVHFGPVNPDAAREIFIHYGLVEGTVHSGGDFLQKNQTLLDEIDKLESKQRKRDLLVDSATRYAFFDARVPKGVHSTELFEAWRTRAERRRSDILHMRREDLIRPDATLPSDELYPSTMPTPAGPMPIDYSLVPGEQHDGLTLTVPVEAINQVDAQRGEWLVPGLIREKIIELVRGLPKHYRRYFGPAPAFADAVLSDLPFAQGSLLTALQRRIERENGITIPMDVWRAVQLPHYLAMTYRVVDRDGKELAKANDIEVLRRRFATLAQQRLRQAADVPIARERVVEWDFGDLPTHIDLHRFGAVVTAHVALDEAEGSAAIRIFDTPEHARASMHKGLRRLFMLAARSELKALIDRAREIDALAINYSTLGPAAELRDELVCLTCELAFLDGVDPWTVRSKDRFDQLLRAGLRSVHTTVGQAIALLAQVLGKRQQVLATLASKHPPAWAPAAQQIAQHVQSLVPRRLASTTPLQHMRDIPRYLDAMLMRWQRLIGDGLERDQRASVQIVNDEAIIQRALAAGLPPDEPALQSYRWALEELRVNLFAPALAVRGGAARKKLDDLRAQLERRIVGERERPPPA